MSKISLEPNASGAGTFTLAAPNSNTNRTLNLPDESGVLFSDGSGVPGSAVTGQLASSNMPAGSVIQVVSKIFSDTTVTTSSSYVDVTNSNFSIIPSSASSKILVLYSLVYRFRPDGGSQTSFAKIVRNDSVDVWESEFLSINLDRLTISLVMQYLDSPATISSVTYKAQTRMSRGTNIVVNDNTADSSITLMEIAG